MKNAISILIDKLTLCMPPLEPLSPEEKNSQNKWSHFSQKIKDCEESTLIEISGKQKAEHMYLWELAIIGHDAAIALMLTELERSKDSTSDTEIAFHFKNALMFAGASGTSFQQTEIIESHAYFSLKTKEDLGIFVEAIGSAERGILSRRKSDAEKLEDGKKYKEFIDSHLDEQFKKSGVASKGKAIKDCMIQFHVKRATIYNHLKFIKQHSV